KVAVQIQSDRLRDKAQAENEEFLKNLAENIQKIIKEQVKEQVKVQVFKSLSKIEKTVNEQLEAEVLTRSSNSSKISYVVIADLSEIELKKILIEKMESNKSIHRSDEQRSLYKALRDKVHWNCCYNLGGRNWYLGEQCSVQNRRDKPPKYFRCGFFMERDPTSSIDEFSWGSICRTFNTSNLFSGPSTPLSYSLGPSTPPNYSSRSLRNAECSNCKHLHGKISELKAIMNMHMHPKQHAVYSAALLYEVLNEMEKLDLE
nr:hypothetical protein [Tanacetum cinerariifolium]